MAGFISTFDSAWWISWFHSICVDSDGKVLYILLLFYINHVTFTSQAVGNLESTMFGKNFQLKLFPEIILCLGIALTASGMVHRICTTVW